MNNCHILASVFLFLAFTSYTSYTRLNGLLESNISGYKELLDSTKNKLYEETREMSYFETRETVKELIPLTEGESATIHNKELGDIEYPIGKIGKHEYGLLHIVEQRMKKDGVESHMI